MTHEYREHMQGRHEQYAGKDVTKLTQFLGWFSLGLGITEVIAPDSILNLVGVRAEEDGRLMTRMCGVREIMAGVGILSQQESPFWIWVRVAGDVMDASSLGLAMTKKHTDMTRLNLSMSAVAGIMALDIYTGAKLTKRVRKMRKMLEQYEEQREGGQFEQEYGSTFHASPNA